MTHWTCPACGLTGLVDAADLRHATCGRCDHVPARAMTSECRYRKTEIRRDECPTCRGRVQVKVFGCTIHGECTIAKPLPGITCCPCESFQQQQDEPN